jgi:hypothetical protein
MDCYVLGFARMTDNNEVRYYIDMKSIKKVEVVVKYDDNQKIRL